MKKISFLTFLILLAVSTPCFADTIQVPADQPTIQAGIDAALNGDTVLVAPGTYVETLDFLGKDISLISSQGPETTVIDGNQTSCVVAFENGESMNALLSGFTLTNGIGKEVNVGPFYSRMGGAVYITESSPTIRGNIICGNTAEQGGGVECQLNSTSLIVENTITDNSAIAGGGIRFVLAQGFIRNNIINSNSANSGGGIYTRSSVTEITGNVIYDNDANGAINFAKGGGICSSTSDDSIIGNLIFNNSCTWIGGGISSEGDIELKNTMLIGNAATDGGGVYFERGSTRVTGCTIFGNTATLAGGGVNSTRFSNEYALHPEIYNSILWGNAAPAGSQIAIATDCSTAAQLTIANSDVQGGESDVFVETGCRLHWGSGMIDLDPQFSDPIQNDCHITHPSPCRDTGDNSHATESVDFEADPRIAFGTVDMGADEFYNHFYCTGDFAPSGSIAGKFIGLPDTWPVGLFIGSGVSDPPLQHKWGEFFLQSPWILFPLIPIPADGLLVIPATLPGSPVPYDIPMQALIGWELSNLFVLPVR